MSARFQLTSPYQPTGDQPTAIDALVKGVNQGLDQQVLLGATGTGKTFTMANVIQSTGRPTLLISHNKTLAAQLYEELRELFPDSAVSYFVSYYDYYQPEAYIPQRDIYIEKDASRNDDLDRLRLATTSSLLSRQDVIVVSSVSCLFGLGSPVNYGDRVIALEVGQEIDRRELLIKLTDMQYGRNEIEFKRGQFRLRGEILDVYPAYEQYAIRVEFFGDEIQRIELIHPVSGEPLARETRAFIFPAVHYVLPEDQLEAAVTTIKEEAVRRCAQLKKEGKLLESQRLMARTRYDMEMIQEVGYCPGIENYARHLEGRPAGSRPSTLLDYFSHVPGLDPQEWLVFIDESHVTIPQIRAMYNGDRARKQVLVDHGFRLPSAMDNRPLKFDEFLDVVPQLVYVSATPGPWELEQADGAVVEQLIRPTGLLDPIVTVRPASNQVQDLVEECRIRIERNQRVLVTVLTKRMAEDLTSWMDEQSLRVRYLHSDIDTLDRIEILRDLRSGDFDVLIGVNLLREGLDLPEVSLVGILDADKSGFLRSETSLVQTIGRAARHVDAEVIMYGDSITPQMRSAIDETERRRTLQMEHNKANGITPQSITKAIRRGIDRELEGRRTARAAFHSDGSEVELDQEELLEHLEQEMLEAAEKLEFEQAAAIRDRMEAIKSGHDHDPERSSAGRPGQARSRIGITRPKRKS
ncbi:MAG: excinuclease ABC subunit UvrB [Phycisphaerales bacterium]|nr:excinuclease ABC subunit UvrB [Phycisphaerales bacterium]